METANHFLAQLQQKMVQDSTKLKVLEELLLDLQRLEDDNVKALFEKHGVSLNDTTKSA